MPRTSSARWRLALVAVFAALSCTEDQPLSPLSQQPSFGLTAPATGVVISHGNSFNAKLQAARRALDRGDNGAALGQLNALLNEINALIRAGRLSAADAGALTTLVRVLIAIIAT